MEKDSAKETFMRHIVVERKKLEYIPSESDRLSKKYDETVESLLKEAEKHFLEKEPIASVYEIIKEASKAIEENETPNSIEILLQFEVDVLGFHGPQCYPIRQVEFVKAIEDGKNIDDLITGFRIFLREKNNRPTHYESGYDEYKTLGFIISVSKDKESPHLFEIDWNIGYDDGKIKLQDSSIEDFAKVVAERVVKGHYEPRSGGNDMGEGWSLN